jgi:hypothetical protein
VPNVAVAVIRANAPIACEIFEIINTASKLSVPLVALNSAAPLMGTFSARLSGFNSIPISLARFCPNGKAFGHIYLRDTSRKRLKFGKNHV